MFSVKKMKKNLTYWNHKLTKEKMFVQNKLKNALENNKKKWNAKRFVLVGGHGKTTSVLGRRRTPNGKFSSGPSASRTGADGGLIDSSLESPSAQPILSYFWFFSNLDGLWLYAIFDPLEWILTIFGPFYRFGPFLKIFIFVTIFGHNRRFCLLLTIFTLLKFFCLLPHIIWAILPFLIPVFPHYLRRFSCGIQNADKSIKVNNWF